MELKVDLEISEQEVQEYASKRVKERINKFVDDRMKEIAWHNMIDRIVFSVVEKHVTLDKCNAILAEIDRQQLINTISRYLAERITDRLVSDY